MTMVAKKTLSQKQLVLWLVLLASVLFLLGFVQFPARSAFVSSEVQFTDPSDSGLQIMPASCASGEGGPTPQYYHGNLSATGDGLGYFSVAGELERGAYRNSVYICISNTTTVNVFVPANTAAEMNALKAVGATIPQFMVW